MKSNTRRAWVAWELKRYEEAARLAKLAVAGDPQDPDGYLILGKALAATGHANEGLIALARASSLAPEWARPHVVRSDLLAERGDLDGALQAADEAARLNPGLVSAHLARALRLKALGRQDDAVAAAEKALEIDPADAFVLATRGDVVLDARPAEAESFYRRSLEADPQRATTMNNLGASLWRQQRYAEARDAYQDAVRIDPTLAVARTNLEQATRKLQERCEGCGAPGVPLVVTNITTHSRLGSWAWPRTVRFCHSCLATDSDRGLGIALRHLYILASVWALGLAIPWLVLFVSYQGAHGDDRYFLLEQVLLRGLWAFGPWALVWLLRRLYPAFTLRWSRDADAAARLPQLEFFARTLVPESERILWAGWQLGTESATVVTDRRVANLSRGKIEEMLELSAVRSVGTDGKAVVFYRRRWPPLHDGPRSLRIETGGDPWPVHEVVRRALAEAGRPIDDATPPGRHGMAAVPSDHRYPRWAAETIGSFKRVGAWYRRLEAGSQLIVLVVSVLGFIGSATLASSVVRYLAPLGQLLAGSFTFEIPTALTVALVLSGLGYLLTSVFRVTWSGPGSEFEPTEGSARPGGTPSADAAAYANTPDLGSTGHRFAAALLDLEAQGCVHISETPYRVLAIDRGELPIAFLPQTQRAIAEVLFDGRRELLLAPWAGDDCEVVAKAVKAHTEALGGWGRQHRLLLGTTKGRVASAMTAALLVALPVVAKAMHGMPMWTVVLALGASAILAARGAQRLCVRPTGAGRAMRRRLRSSRRHLGRRFAPALPPRATTRRAEALAFALGLWSARGQLLQNAVNATLSARPGRVRRAVRELQRGLAIGTDSRPIP